VRVTIALCTRNNCASLLSTLDSFHRVKSSRLGRLARLRARGYPPAQEGIDEEELRPVATVHEIVQWTRERRRPRHYEKHGLRRLAGV